MFVSVVSYYILKHSQMIYYILLYCNSTVDFVSWLPNRKQVQCKHV